jgi:hypothetical protein
MMRAVVAVLGVLAVVACGSSGDDDAPDVATEEDGGVLSPDMKDVTGTFHLGDGTTPAKDFELWIVDHTIGTIQHAAVADDGAFSFPVASLVADHGYSFHVVKDYVLYGDLDFDPGTAGLQGGVTYGGGYGFSVGAIDLELDTHGFLAPGGNLLPAAIGGSFAVDGSAGTLDTLGLPADLAIADAASQLDVFDASTLLYSFYRSGSNPSLYARDLAALSRIGTRIETSVETAVTRAIVSEAGAWLRTSKVATATADPAGQLPAAAPFWSATDFQISPLAGARFATSAYPGGVPAIGTLIGVKLTPSEGAATTVFRALTTVLARPPSVLAADGAGGAAAAIDYASDSARNGLVRPVCVSADLNLTVAPPTDLADVAIADGTFDVIDVELDYYGRSGGRSVPVAPTVDQFSSPYEAATSGTANDLAWTWDPSARRLRFALAAGDQTAASHALTDPAALLPDAFGAAGVFTVRLRIYYRSTRGAIEGGMAFWLDLGC